MRVSVAAATEGALPSGPRGSLLTLEVVTIERAIVLPVRVEEAWTTVTDWERQADWMLDADDVTVVSGGREGLGLRIAARTRILGIPAFTERLEVVDWDPPRRLAMRHGPPIAGTGVWTLDPVDHGTRFTWREDVTIEIPMLGSVAARLYGPVMGWLMDRSLRQLRASVVAAGPRRA